MEPVEPTSSTPQLPTTPSSQPTPPSQPSRRLWIGIAIALIIVLAAAWWLSHRSASKQAGQTDNSLTYDRPGYDRASLGGDIADPLGLKLSTLADPVKLNTGTAIAACSVITAHDITQTKLKLYPNAYGTPFQQNYIDKSGKASFTADLNNLPLGSDAPSCNYGLNDPSKSGLQTVGITVNQPFTVSDQVVSDYVSRYTPQPDMSGYKVYKKVSDITGASYILKDADATVELSLDLKDQTIMDSLLKTAVANLKQLKNQPKGRVLPSFDSPTFMASYPKACDLIDNDDVKQLTGRDASPLVTERWPTATALADFSKTSDYKAKTNYVRNVCVRRAPQPGYNALGRPGDDTIQVTTTTYENETAASKGLVSVSVGDDNTKTKVTGFGQEAYLYRDIKDHQLVVAGRQGRVVVELLYNFAKQTDSPDSMLQKLSPLAEKVAGKLTSYK